MSAQDQAAIDARPRLSTLEAAWVIARRDFLAVLFSRAFLFFLLGPLFPVIVGGLAGSIGGQVQRDATSIEIGLAMDERDNAAIKAAGAELAQQLRGTFPPMRIIPEAAGNPGFDARRYLEERRGNYAVVVTGNLARPEIIGTADQVERWRGAIELAAARAVMDPPAAAPPVAASTILASSAASERVGRVSTAQAAQLLLFLLTMLLAGMVLSNLVEEKANKIIEILAAAIPMDAVFMGKLFAMLGVSFVGISVWGLAGAGLWALAGNSAAGAGGASGADLGALAAPAVGWAVFVPLAITYFAMAYLLLGALFLTIGAMASTVREVQTLSMPVTMLQLMVFFLAAYTITQPGSALEMAALAFPLSSPFAMVARAAMDDSLWLHAAALAWQGLWVVLLVKGGSLLFRKRVMKSGSAGRVKKARWAKRPSGAEPAE
ncbi:MAG: ABC transporter permease [Erythrobacter sp.]